MFSNPYIKLAFEARNGDVYLVNGDKTIEVLSGQRISARYPSQVWPAAFAEDDRSVLVGMKGELFRIVNGKLQHYEFQAGQQPVFYWINDLHVAQDGAIWVASNAGIFRIKEGKVKRWSISEGLTGNGVRHICDGEDGSIWAGLETGIARIKGTKLNNITQENGLHDNRVHAIVADDQGAFWMTSGHGIFRVSRKSLNDFADGKSPRIQCDMFDGLESVKYTDRTDQENSGCKTLDGRIWFPNPRGVVMIDPAHISRNDLAPPVHIERVLGNGKEFARLEDIVVPAAKGEMAFHFTALSFIAPKKVQLRYRLEGYDKDWVESPGRRMAFYTNLSPGSYTFRVIAANADGVWNSAGDSVRFEMQPHFHQTAWFTLLCGGLLGAGLAGIYIWRVRHLKSKQRALQIARDLLEAEVQKRTAELAQANSSLQGMVEDHQRTGAQLAQRSQSLEIEIEERKKFQLENQRVHQQLLETSRQAGMAEIATNVLHNVGNVLNSVNVSANLVTESVKNSKAAGLSRVVELLNDHEHDLATFLTDDARGKNLPMYLTQLAAHIQTDREMTVKELDSLKSNIDHIKEIVAMQQNYARVSGIKEAVNVIDLVEDSVRMNLGSLERHGVEVVREFESVPELNVDKHKVLQILVNLMRNAKFACDESGRADGRMTLQVASHEGHIQISVNDNGVGIPPENMTRIFSHGFTTRKSGHGFGLHSGALAAKEMGGSLTVHSDGLGHGATFTLELPLNNDIRFHTEHPEREVGRFDSRSLLISTCSFETE